MWTRIFKGPLSLRNARQDSDLHRNAYVVELARKWLLPRTRSAICDFYIETASEVASLRPSSCSCEAISKIEAMPVRWCRSWKCTRFPVSSGSLRGRSCQALNVTELTASNIGLPRRLEEKRAITLSALFNENRVDG